MSEFICCISTAETVGHSLGLELHGSQETLTFLSSPQVQEKGTYDLLAPLALLFYSTVLCVSLGGPGAEREEREEWLPSRPQASQL